VFRCSVICVLLFGDLSFSDLCFVFWCSGICDSVICVLVFGDSVLSDLCFGVRGLVFLVFGDLSFRDLCFGVRGSVIQ